MCRMLCGQSFGCGRETDERTGEQHDEIYAVFVDTLRDGDVLVDAAQLDTEPGISISSPGRSFG